MAGGKRRTVDGDLPSVKCGGDVTGLSADLLSSFKAQWLVYRCPGRNVPDFGRMLLKLKYTDLTKNTYIRS